LAGKTVPIVQSLREDRNAEMSVDEPSHKGQRVLLVDDEPRLLEAMKMAFEAAGRDVAACRTFEEARNRLLGEKFHCLIADVRLGAFNGLQLAVIARDRNPDMGIIMFSGFDDPVLREEAANLRATYLVKPVTAERLLQLADHC
jgi:DNA-binding response OmpR family regulator